MVDEPITNNPNNPTLIPHAQVNWGHQTVITSKDFISDAFSPWFIGARNGRNLMLSC